jgi:hypothetical protein
MGIYLLQVNHVEKSTKSLWNNTSSSRALGVVVVQQLVQDL